MKKSPIRKSPPNYAAMSMVQLRNAARRKGIKVKGRQTKQAFTEALRHHRRKSLSPRKSLSLSPRKSLSPTPRKSLSPTPRKSLSPIPSTHSRASANRRTSTSSSHRMRKSPSRVEIPPEMEHIFKTILGCLPGGYVMIGKGVFGWVFKIAYTDRVALQMKHVLLPSLRHRVTGAPLPHVGGHLVIKINRQLSKADHWFMWDKTRERFVERVTEESKIHKSIYESCNNEFGVCGKDVTVPFYFGGVMSEFSLPELHVSCMGVAPGVPLAPPGGRMSREEYAAIEESLRNLLLLGFVHDDLHHNNMFITRVAGRYHVTIIDFGKTYMFPPSWMPKIHKAFGVSHGNLEKKWSSTGLPVPSNIERLPGYRQQIG